MEKKTKVIAFRVTEDDYELLELAAAKEGLNVGKLVRKVLGPTIMVAKDQRFAKRKREEAKAKREAKKAAEAAQAAEVPQ